MNRSPLITRAVIALAIVGGYFLVSLVLGSVLALTHHGGFQLAFVVTAACFIAVGVCVWKLND